MPDNRAFLADTEGRQIKEASLPTAGKRSLLDFGKDLLWPKHCPVCLEALPPGGKLICPECIPKIRRISGAVCYRCGKRLAEENREYCKDCERRMPAFLQSIAWADYSSKYMRRMMAEVKYHGNRQLLDYPCREFGVKTAEKIAEWQPEALIPVPVHEKRRRIRGYNQAEEMADRLSDIWQIPVDAHYLFRTNETKAQKELSRDGRMMNLLQAFSVKGPKGKYKKVILIDDIYTTGSTLSACAHVLNQAGIPEVFGAVLCIGRDR